jgi:hypothetical protein
MLNQNEDYRARESALNALSFIEIIESLIVDFTAYTNCLPAEYQIEATLYLSRIKTLREALDDEGFDPSILGASASLSKKLPSKIQRMGVASQIISMREEGKFTIKEISERFGISAPTVKTFLDAYDKAKPVEKTRIAKTSVYDIQENMENLHGMLLRTIARFELDGDINNKNLSEYRQLLALANKQLKEYQSAQKYNQIAALIEQILLEYCDKEARSKIVAEFQRLGLSGFFDTIPSERPTERKVLNAI